MYILLCNVFSKMHLYDISNYLYRRRCINIFPTLQLMQLTLFLDVQNRQFPSHEISIYLLRLWSTGRLIQTCAINGDGLR